METTNVDIGALFGREIQFIIPLFQRHYVWTEVEQWEPLWSDIEGKVCQRLSEEHQEQQFFPFYWCYRYTTQNGACERNQKI